MYLQVFMFRIKENINITHDIKIFAIIYGEIVYLIRIFLLLRKQAGPRKS